MSLGSCGWGLVVGGGAYSICTGIMLRQAVARISTMIGSGDVGKRQRLISRATAVGGV